MYLLSLLQILIVNLPSWALTSTRCVQQEWAYSLILRMATLKHSLTKTHFRLDILQEYKLTPSKKLDLTFLEIWHIHGQRKKFRVK